MSGGRRIAWIDASAGIAGDMLLAALVDAGALLATAQDAVDAVIPGTVRLTRSDVVRAGLRATAVHVDLLAADQPHRSWSRIRSLLEAAPLADRVRDRAVTAFAALASAEARVHGVGVDDVHFHEVGGWDAIADVVGASAALEDLGAGEVVLGDLAVGSGQVRTRHGTLPVPVPAVLELCRGRVVSAGGDGELATPTGVALATTLAARSGPLPAMVVERVGVGAGSRERADRPNVVRVVVGTPPRPAPGTGPGPGGDPPGERGLETMVLLETNVDDLDPRVWPSVVEELLAAGAADAWLTPVIMKKGRPGHVLGVLAVPAAAPALRRLVLDRTTALGVRQSVVGREVLERVWIDVELPGALTTGPAGPGGHGPGGHGPGGHGPGGHGPGERVPVKVGHRGGTVVHATPEFEDAARLAAASGRPVREVLEAAAAAARSAGIVPGAPLPDPGRR